jgi:glucose 1-dehydrogenase
MRSLEGKVAVITGSTRGLGLEIARAYIQAGAAVIVASRSPQAVESAINTLSKEDGRVSGIACDVGDLSGVEALADHAVQKYGHFDLWVNNAGVSAPYGPTVDIQPEDFVRTLQTDIFGVYYGSITAMRHFLSRKSGKLLNILGRGDRQTVPMQNAYASSKTWVRNFTLALAKEYKDSEVGVYAFNPGLMDTDLMQKVDVIEGYQARLKPLGTVMRLWANPPRVPAQRAVWLASAATDGRTGLEIHQLNAISMFSGVVREGLRRLTGRSEPPYQLDIHLIPPAIDLPEPSP